MTWNLLFCLLLLIGAVIAFLQRDQNKVAMIFGIVLVVVGAIGAIAVSYLGM